MKKTIAIFLLSIYLISSAELYELLKVNVLLEHYGETAVHNGAVSFVDFLIMHYVTDDGNSNDNDRDRQLPFKSTHQYITGSLAAAILQRNEEMIIPALPAGTIKFYNHSNESMTSNFYNMVWNPPKPA